MREYSPLKRERCEDGERELVIQMRRVERRVNLDQ